jgi:fatty-acyl-CoA synthase
VDSRYHQYILITSSINVCGDCLFGYNLTLDNKTDLNALSLQRCTWQARDGLLDDAQVMNPDTMLPVTADSTTMGEVMLRGNLIMKGYLKNPAATEEAFKDGWFHTGDLAVSHPNGRFEIKDRSKGTVLYPFVNVYDYAYDYYYVAVNFVYT